MSRRELNVKAGVTTECEHLELLRRVARRDETAIAELYSRHAASVFRFISNRIEGQREDTEELTLAFNDRRSCCDSAIVTFTRAFSLNFVIAVDAAS